MSPWWGFCPVVVGCEIDFSVAVELVEVVECEGARCVFYFFAVDGWVGVV